MRTYAVPVAVAVAAAVLAAACGAAVNPSASTMGDRTLRLGYFPNLTHAPALVGIEGGTFADRLGPNVKFETSSFNAGPAAIEALLSGGLDATYIGPNPAINAYAQSDGEAVRIVAGSTSGGAFLVVRDGIDEPGDLAGTTLASPSRGNTQDVALRTWLAGQGFATTLEGGGDVSVAPQENSQTLETFRAGRIDGAWVPEPWATRLILEGGGHVLVDERTLWPGGEFVTTHLIARTDYLAQNPEVIRRLVEAHNGAVDFIGRDPNEAKRLTNLGIERVTGKPLAEDTLDAAWANLTFTVDPEASSLRGAADHAVEVGLLDPVDLTGIYDLTALNAVLAALGRREVAGL
jgi:NitT/TauT family transport system substrate-binding protein